MPRWAGIKNNRIQVISSDNINNQDFQVIELPPTFYDLDSKEIIAYSSVVNSKIKCSLIKKPMEDLKVAFVSNHKQQCGISSYGEYLFPEIAKSIGDLKLFIERSDNLTGDIHQFGEQILSDRKVVSCWKRGETLQELAIEIKKYDPDVVVINHEFGIFPNAKSWLSLLTQLSDYRVIVIAHSIFPDHDDKLVFLAAIKELIVHLPEAKTCLENVKKITAKINYIPHGCYPIVSDQSRLWNNYKSEHTFIQHGFGFPYKNFTASIRATAILKDKYPDIFFTALLSESPHNKIGHQTYFNSLIDLVNGLGLQENVALVRGFQPDIVINSYLRSNRVAVFPYQMVQGHSVFGASGASRGAMACGIPVISSSIFHFSDLPTIKADAPEDIARQLDLLFSDKALVKEQVEKQNQFILANSWEKVAEKYLDILENG